MTPLYSVLAVLIGTYYLLSLSVVLTLSSKYKYYKLTYQLLYSGNYIFSTENDMYIRFSRPNQVNNLWSSDEILYFKEDGAIKLIDGYIHTSLMIWFDLYTLYWYFKIKKLIQDQTRLNLIRVR
jgi:hypothetical protein